MTDTVTKLHDLSEELRARARMFLEKPLTDDERERIKCHTGLMVREDCSRYEALRMINECLSERQENRLRQSNDDDLIIGLCNIIDDLRFQIEELEAHLDD